MAYGQGTAWTRAAMRQRLSVAYEILQHGLGQPDCRGHVLFLALLKRLNDGIFACSLPANAPGDEDQRPDSDIDDMCLPGEAEWSHLTAGRDGTAGRLDSAMRALVCRNAGFPGGIPSFIRFSPDGENPRAKSSADSAVFRALGELSGLNTLGGRTSDTEAFGLACFEVITRPSGGGGGSSRAAGTPWELSRLIAELVRPDSRMTIHDPAAGCGSLLAASLAYVRERPGRGTEPAISGQEISALEWWLCRLALLLNSRQTPDIQNMDSLLHPAFIEKGRLIRFDRVISHLPFAVDDWGRDKLSEPGNTAGDGPVSLGRFHRGLPPPTKGDMAFLEHMVEICNPNGMVAAVTSQGILFRGGEERKIRASLLEEDLVEAVIALPARLLHGTPAPSALLILNKWKLPERRRHVLFLDASGDEFHETTPEGVRLRQRDILTIAAIFHAFAEQAQVSHFARDIAGMWRDSSRRRRDRLERWALRFDRSALATIANEDGERRSAIIETIEAVSEWLLVPRASGRNSLQRFARVVPVREILEENGANLNVRRYVTPIEPVPSIDLGSEMQEVRRLERERAAAEGRVDEILEGLRAKYGQFRSSIVSELLISTDESQRSLHSLWP